MINNSFRYILFFILSIVLFLIINYVSWFFNYDKLFRPYPVCGDIARILIQPELATCKKLDRNLPHKLQSPFDENENKKFDILTFGDSVSRGRGGGINNYYQDFISTKFKLSTIWLPEINDSNYLNEIIYLKNSGILDFYGIQKIILQTSERHAIPRLSGDYDLGLKEEFSERFNKLKRYKGDLFMLESYFQVNDSIEYTIKNDDKNLLYRAMIVKFIYMHSHKIISYIDTFFQKHLFKTYKKFYPDEEVFEEQILFKNINSLFHNYSEYTKNKDMEWKLAFYGWSDIFDMPAMLNNIFKSNVNSFYYDFSEESNEKIMKFHLTKSLFSGENKKILFVHKGDYKSNKKYDFEKLKKMHQNLNILADFLKESNIDLIFFPTPNKLTIYQDYVLPPLSGSQKSRFYGDMKLLHDKRYKYVDISQLMYEKTKAGVKDLYYFDDTHWNINVAPEFVNLFDDFLSDNI